MVSLYKAIRGIKYKLIGVGRNLTEAVKDAYNDDYLTPCDDFYRKDFDEQIEVLTDYVRTAHQDYVIEYEL